MKRNLFLLCVILVACFLAMACGGDEETKKDDTPTFTVTFYKNNPDIDEGPDVVTRTVRSGEKVLNMPKSEYPVVEEGWNAGYTISDIWNTQADGEGNPFSSGTRVTKDWIVYGVWEIGESQHYDGDSLVVVAPAIGEGGNMHGTYVPVDSEDTIKYKSITWKGGGIRWPYPEESADYDYVEIFYIGKGATANATTIPSNILKQYNSTVDYMPEGGNQYPTFALPTGRIKFKVRDGAGGVAIQINNPGDDKLRTMKFTKAIFTKGERVQVTFDLNFANASPAIPPLSIAKGFTIGTLPYPEAKNTGYFFDGWINAANNNPVTASTVVDGPLALKAVWTAVSSVARINIDDFNAATLTETGGTVAIPAAGESGTASYTFTYGSSGFSGSWAKFNITLGGNVNLAAYKEVTFKLKSVSGNTNYKPFALLAAASFPAALPNNPHENSVYKVNTENFQGTTTSDWVERSFTIDKAKAFGLKGTIQICIYDHSEAAADVNGAAVPTAWAIKDVSFIPEP